MCHVFAGQPTEAYAYVSRSVRLSGFATSVKLEAKFWQLLEEIAEHQGMSVTRFMATLYDEALAIHGEVRNFASLLRCTCLVYLTEVRDPPFAARMAGEPHLIAAE